MSTIRSVEELTSGDSLWPTITKWVRQANVTIDVLPRTDSDAEREIAALQVTTRSALGAIVFESGGIMLDHKWLRLLGTGLKDVSPSIGHLNGLLDSSSASLIPGTLVFAWDVLGGIFVINENRLPFRRGNVCYFAPDSLAWMDTQMGHAEFCKWSFTDSLPRFFHHLRWSNWAAQVTTIPADHGLALYPPLFSKEGTQIENAAKKSVPTLDLLRLQIHYGKEVGNFDSIERTC
ncbi:MAG: DUF2625 family protein [Candidatus Eremiobacteraeota bacterium]|nr:DUF2625 family protein [Candidatus Eremiobacteraeota bacterium]